MPDGIILNNYFRKLVVIKFPFLFSAQMLSIEKMCGFVSIHFIRWLLLLFMMTKTIMNDYFQRILFHYQAIISYVLRQFSSVFNFIANH